MHRFLPHVQSRRTVMIVVFVCLAAQASLGQFWEKKPYQNWSKDDVAKMLSDSPWSKEIVLSNVSASTVNVNRRGQVAQGNNESLGAQVIYQVQIRSAKPVRQAVVRAAQMSPRYEQMPAEQKQRVNASAEQFINSTSDEISFWVIYSCTDANLASDLARYWTTQSPATQKNRIWLQVPGAQKEEFTSFAPGPDHSFEVRFPRPKQLPANGVLVLEFEHPSGVADQRGQKVLAEFKTSKLSFSGAPAY